MIAFCKTVADQIQLKSHKAAWNFGLLCKTVFVFGVMSMVQPAVAQTTVSLSQTPLLALKTTPGLVMLNMSRDHRLFYSAYNDTSDLNGDGLIDVGFKPAISYYGYFANDRCYEYQTGSTPNRFVPVALAKTADGCKTQTGRWHGNWLNWALTSRMDALRKVLYGGYRQTDTLSRTILEAANIPGDSHVWGKEYRPTQVTSWTGFNTTTLTMARNTQSTASPVYGPAIDAGYDITWYTPLAAPTAGKMHIFLVKSEGDAASVYQNRKVPTFRVQENVDAMIDRVWLWASDERPIGGPNGQFHFKRRAGCFTNSGLPGIEAGCPTTNLTVNRPVPVTNLFAPQGNPVVYTSKYPAQDYTAATYALEVRVQTCVAIGGVVESNCNGYPATSPTTYKPTGVLHEYGESDRLKFGLLTGSYTNNYSGGVVRKDIGSFKNEVDSTNGKFITTVDGIVKTIDRITTYGFNGSSGYDYTCGFNFTSLRTQGQCNMWGAPVAEMMFEGLRYFAAQSPNSAFTSGVSTSTSPDSRLGLPLVSAWSNPFRKVSAGGSPICSRPVQMVIADPVTSFDSDQLPGASFSISTGYGNALGAGSGNLNGSSVLNVATEADDIWSQELLAATSTKPAGTLYGSSKNFFMGQTTLTNADGNPTPKATTTFATLRGHGPDETNTQGSYYAASVAKFGHEKGVLINDGVIGGTTQVVNVDTISVALGSTIPRLEINYAGNTVTLVPFSKSVGSGGIDSALGKFQPTGLITLMYIDSIFNTHASNMSAAVNGGRPYIRFMASFSDMDQGGDNEADANVYYTLTVNSTGQLIVDLETYYQAGNIQQNMGYIISGTTKDGVYLEVADEAPTNPIYYLDTLAGQDPAPPTGRTNTLKLGKTASRTFTLGAGSGGTFVPKDPLWYAAKYGGAAAFDSNNDPTNYFKVINPTNLPTQMGKAFRSASALAAVASTSVVGVGQRSLGTAAIYQANYDSLTWTSRLYAFQV
jgi:type IV pilus assembly protein PilY1